MRAAPLCGAWGWATPAAPTGADSGSGSFSGKRYYRVRYTVQSGGVTIRRSEPSSVLTKTPSGSGSGITITKPASISESETHWELEASLNNADFYVIATSVVGTTTATDTTAFSTGYAGTFTLSPRTGLYEVPHSCKFLAADDDRLLMLGSHEDSSKSARFSWTVKLGDVTGVGNEERVPTGTTAGAVNFQDLDGLEGGPPTGMVVVNGVVWLFKRTHTYKAIPTGVLEKAYRIITASKTLGAIEDSAVEAMDASGQPCLYFLDPESGPCRTGGNGKEIQRCGRDIQNT